MTRKQAKREQARRAQEQDEEEDFQSFTLASGDAASYFAGMQRRWQDQLRQNPDPGFVRDSQ